MNCLQTDSIPSVIAEGYIEHWIGGILEHWSKSKDFINLVAAYVTRSGAESKVVFECAQNIFIYA